MQYNPFEVRNQTGANKGEAIDNIIDQVTDNLINNHYKLIAQVEAGSVSRVVLEAEIIKIIDSMENNYIPRDTIIGSVFDNVFGYGPLEPFIKNNEISDILINSPNMAYIKAKGVKSRINIDFGTNQRLLSYCRKVAAICGGRINENESEAVITDRKRNLRIVISIEPINIGSPSISIRKPTTGFLLSDLIELGMIDKLMYNHLKESIRSKDTIIIAGKGGSGKTTLLGALINEVPYSERGLLIQETNEISVTHPDIVSQLIKTSDIAGNKNYSLFELTKFGLLMSLDRMFIGELKDREAFDFFNAVFTGHTGSMATVHANSAEETVDRLVLLMKRADTNLSGGYLKELLVSALEQIIFVQDYKVREIARIEGYDNKKGEIIYQKLFSLNEKGRFLKLGAKY